MKFILCLYAILIIYYLSLEDTGYERYSCQKINSWYKESKCYILTHPYINICDADAHAYNCTNLNDTMSDTHIVRFTGLGTFATSNTKIGCYGKVGNHWDINYSNCYDRTILSYVSMATIIAAIIQTYLNI